MRKFSIGLLALFFLVLAVSAAAAKEYRINWFNNMNVFPDEQKNPDGFCTNLKVELFAPNGSLMGSATSSERLMVQTGTSMTVSTSSAPSPSNSCGFMRLSGTCTFKYGKGPTETKSTSREEKCSSGRAVFLNHNFGIMFYPE